MWSYVVRSHCERVTLYSQTHEETEVSARDRGGPSEMVAGELGLSSDKQRRSGIATRLSHRIQILTKPFVRGWQDRNVSGCGTDLASIPPSTRLRLQPTYSPYRSIAAEPRRTRSAPPDESSPMRSGGSGPTWSFGYSGMSNPHRLRFVSNGSSPREVYSGSASEGTCVGCLTIRV